MFKKIAVTLVLLSALLFGALFTSEAHAAQTASSAVTEAAEPVTGFTISSSRIDLGESVTMRLNRADKKQTYSVSYYVRSAPGAKWLRIAYGENKYAIKYYPKKSQNYQFRATASGTDGRTV